MRLVDWRGDWLGSLLTTLVGIGAAWFFFLNFASPHVPDPVTGRIYEVPARYRDFYVDRFQARTLWVVVGVVAAFFAHAFGRFIFRRRAGAVEKSPPT